MSEELEQNEGTWSGLKKTIIGVATTAVMGLGTWGVTKITGGGDESAPAPAAPAPVINITTTTCRQPHLPICLLLAVPITAFTTLFMTLLLRLLLL